MSRKIAASWDEDAATGRLVFARGGPVPAAPGWPRPTPSRLARGGPTETDQSQTGTTTPRLARGGPTAGVVELTREEGALIMTLTATDAELERLERVVGTRLARFGQKDGLAVAWTREDGACGPVAGGPATQKVASACFSSPAPPSSRPEVARRAFLARSGGPGAGAGAVGVVSHGVRAGPGGFGLPAGGRRGPLPGGSGSSRAGCGGAASSDGSGASVEGLFPARAGALHYGAIPSEDAPAPPGPCGGAAHWRAAPPRADSGFPARFRGSC